MMQTFLRLVAAIYFLGVFSLTAIASDSIFDAAKNGDVETLHALLQSGSNPNPERSSGRPTPLFFAAERDHAEAVELLLEYGAEVNADTTRGSALHIAARRGHARIVELLLKNGADPNLIGGDKKTRPLHEAAYRGSVEIVNLLIDNGADVNARTEFRGEDPAIHVAAQRGKEDVVALLRERGFQPWTPEPITVSELASADLKVGKTEVHECTPCHALEPDGFGRRAGSLWNIIGQPKAADPNFSYSEAMRKEKGEWDFEALNIYLADVTGSVPGTAKYYGTIRDREARIAAIAYLRTLTDSPIPLE